LTAAWSAVALPHAAAAQTAAAITAPAIGGERWAPDGIAKLGSDLDAMLADAPALRGAHVGVFAIDTASGSVLYARSADDEFQTASTLKLLVGSVALDRLGGAYRFRTEASVRGGILVVKAGGDPSLATADLSSLADSFPTFALAPSDVRVDASHFDRAPYPAGWTWDDFSYDYAVPLSAATIDENVRAYAVLPGSGVGASVRVADAGAVLDQPRCGVGGAGFQVTATMAAAGTTSTIDTRTVSPGCTEIDGTLPLGSTDSVTVAVRDPEANFARAVQLAFVARSAVTGVTRAPSPAQNNSPWVHESPALEAWLGPRFWIPSDNLFGELLLKELGFVSHGAPGSTEHGIDAEKAWLVDIGVDPATVTLADGCGMSQYDRITPRDLVAILQHDWNGPNRQIVLGALPVGGARGTIEGIAGTAAAGRVFAKTGSMMHVRGLAGYLATRRHGAVTFAFNVDDWNGDYTALAAIRARVLSRFVSD
jgi:D-alanyl-D-alanine carboxypeptidase/D-alanyl-D-alanine-endopeptidase (penicillin-binding protein 4)